MPDLLTHVLLVYAGLTALSWQIDSIKAPWVALAMVGTVIPDLAKIRFVVEAQLIEAWLGLPFSWMPIHRLGGAVLLAASGALVIERHDRWPGIGFLLVGIGIHLPLDALIQRANGLSPPYLWPLTWWHPPAGMLYLSQDFWPSLIALIVAGSIWYLDHNRRPTARTS
jgi:hypothetical protein